MSALAEALVAAQRRALTAMRPGVLARLRCWLRGHDCATKVRGYNVCVECGRWVLYE